ncbi:hypothetical protein ACFL1X_04430 [Candidatus Hydrogenedentota bacterium]
MIQANSRSIRTAAGLVLATILMLCPGCVSGYGPAENHSAFVSAKLAGDERTVIFSYHEFFYRRATGFRAFPDGGIPKYLTDRNYLGTYNMDSQEVRILASEKNTKWQNGQGNFFIVSVEGQMALISQAGQLRGPFAHDIERFLVDVDSEEKIVFDLETDLAEHDRAGGQMYLVDAEGTLLLISPSIQEAEENSNWNRDDSIVPEIWVRLPDGEYKLAAASRFYERVVDGEVIYWVLETRKYIAFNIETGVTRQATEYKVPPYEDVTKGVLISRDKQYLEFGTRKNGKWNYEPLPLAPEMFL